ncbi:helix-turn-helix domain-containing protein [Micromonospora inyonensis]|uniref:Winged helix-turn helix n=1 Tax=Micromonospora inyonensis TaxID=47866 RepID=A0A1C6RGF5_9ACTN|nr:helix-turn-helix domain-containing protein [Micromonospora inyonensis]SCL16253.1 Winged helix-turn helix [Micromonospora inyonensis]
MSAQGQPAPDIAHLLRASEDYVRHAIHAFNERGFDALEPKWSGGAPRRIDEQTRDWICVIARCDPVSSVAVLLLVTGKAAGLPGRRRLRQRDQRRDTTPTEFEEFAVELAHAYPAAV